MAISTATILGLLQGVTEFIPVSSTGHLIIVRDLLGASGSQPLAFDAVLQMATALAIVAYFYRDIKAYILGEYEEASAGIELSSRTIGIIILAMIPAVIAGLWLEPVMETIFRNPKVVAGGLLFGSVLILAAEHIPKSTDKSLSYGRGLLVGLFQVFALLPGTSRSGSTISGGLFAGLTRAKATSFSFLLGAPILLGAGGKKLLDLNQSGQLAAVGWPLLVGSVIAFVSGLLAMHVLMRFVQNHRLDWFAWYRVVVALIVLVLM